MVLTNDERTGAPAADVIITLPAHLDRSAAQQLLVTLNERLSRGCAVWIDASTVETLSLPAVQIFVSAVTRHDSISVLDPSLAFLRTMNELGIVWTHTPVSPPAERLAPAGTPLELDVQAALAPNATVPAKRILTIDDSKTMRDMLMLTLAGAGFEVLQAVDGRDGIDVLARETIDVVITDINMPKLDGYGVIRHLRSRHEFDSTPILVLTTENDTEKKARARDLGATGFIVKPFNPSSLVDVIRKISP